MRGVKHGACQEGKWAWTDRRLGRRLGREGCGEGWGAKAGANDGDRTRGNRYHKPALYQLSYVRHASRRAV